MITLYSNDNCPNCMALKAELDKANIEYTVCSDIDTMINMGLNELPVLEVNGKIINNNEAIDWIKEGANE